MRKYVPCTDDDAFRAAIAALVADPTDYVSSDVAHTVPIGHLIDKTGDNENVALLSETQSVLDILNNITGYKQKLGSRTFYKKGYMRPALHSGGFNHLKVMFGLSPYFALQRFAAEAVREGGATHTAKKLVINLDSLITAKANYLAEKSVATHQELYSALLAAISVQPNTYVNEEYEKTVWSFNWGNTTLLHWMYTPAPFGSSSMEEKFAMIKTDDAFVTGGAITETWRSFFDYLMGPRHTFSQTSCANVLTSVAEGDIDTFLVALAAIRKIAGATSLWVYFPYNFDPIGMAQIFQDMMELTFSGLSGITSLGTPVNKVLPITALDVHYDDYEIVPAFSRSEYIDAARWLSFQYLMETYASSGEDPTEYEPYSALAKFTDDPESIHAPVDTTIYDSAFRPTMNTMGAPTGQTIFLDSLIHQEVNAIVSANVLYTLLGKEAPRDLRDPIFIAEGQVSTADWELYQAKIQRMRKVYSYWADKLLQEKGRVAPYYPVRVTI